MRTGEAAAEPAAATGVEEAEPAAAGTRAAEPGSGTAEARRRGAASRDRAGASGRRRLPWRNRLRELHRDAGYLVVGLTLVYAVSGLAVNHIDDWDPNFEQVRETHQLDGLPVTTEEAARATLRALEIEGGARSVYRAAPERLEIVVDDTRTLHVDPLSGRVLDERREPRHVLRAVNWLHLNRGKQAWTVVADLYAVILIFLAASGLLMVRGRYGVAGRGWVLVVTGFAVPILYVALSGGP